MSNTSLEDWLRNEAFQNGCALIGIAELNEMAQKEFQKDMEINTPTFLIILAMILEDPIQDVWTQAPSWIDGKNYIDEALAHVATLLALKLSESGYYSRPFGYNAAYLKHLAVHAGLGIIGRNNLLITPQYGPHLRLRGLLTQAPLTPSQSLLNSFNPCLKCPDLPPCLEACPAGAFRARSRTDEGQENSNKLQPRSGYAKEICRNYSIAHLKEIGPFTYLWCRACEEACPVGKENLALKLSE